MNDPEGFTIEGLEEYYSAQEREMLKAVQDRLLGYYGAAEPPVRCGKSHLSGLTEPFSKSPVFAG